MSDSKAALTLITIFLVIFLVFVLAGYVLDYVSCLGKVVDIGYPYRFRLIGGCQLEVKDGIWIPLDTYYFRE